MRDHMKLARPMPTLSSVGFQGLAFGCGFGSEGLCLALALALAVAQPFPFFCFYGCDLRERPSSR